MNSLRIFAVILGTIGLISMIGCSRSGFLTESPLESWDDNQVVLRFHAVGLDESANTSNQSQMAKDFFAVDDFSGDGEITGEALAETIRVDCRFSAPTIGPIATGDYADDIDVVTDPANCNDLRNCCVYEIDLGYADPCELRIECIVDETKYALENTQINLGFYLWQHMTTAAMRPNSGLIITSIEETDQALVGNASIFAIDTAQVNRNACSGTVGSQTFQVNDDDPWSGAGGLTNGPDVADTDFLWNVDSIGLVDRVFEGISTCDLYYENITGSVSLEPLSTYDSQPAVTVEEFILIDGIGKICNSLSPTDCDANGTASLEYTVDMYDPAVQGDDLTFVQAGFTETCDSGTEPGTPCTGSGAENVCLPYVINGRPAAPDGCVLYCMDITGLLDAGITPTSTMAQYADTISADADPTGALCTAANGTMIDVGHGSDDTCMPNQLMACLGGGGGSSHYEKPQCITVGTDYPATAEESPEIYRDYMYESGMTLDGNKTLVDMYDDCAAEGKRLYLQYIFATDSVRDDIPECLAVAEKLASNVTVGDNGGDVGLIDVNGDYSLAFDGSNIKIYQDGFQLYWDLVPGFDSLMWDSIVPSNDEIYVWYDPGQPSFEDVKLHTADKATEVGSSAGVCRIRATETEATWGNGVPYHYMVAIRAAYSLTGGENCGLSGNQFELYFQATGYCSEVDEYTRGDGYVSSDTGNPPADEIETASMATIFGSGADALTEGAADWAGASEKTLRDYYDDCVVAHGPGARLAAIAYYQNTEDINTDDNIDDTCRNVAQRFVSTTLAAEGTDQVLTPYNLSVKFENSGAADQGLVIRILDGQYGGSGTSVFEDVGLDPDPPHDPLGYVTGDASPIPAAGFVSNSDQWFSAFDSRPSCQQNDNIPDGGIGGSLQAMSVYTTDGLPKGDDVYHKVSTHLDFHRIRESDLRESDDPENLYILIIDLQEPIDPDGNEYGSRCGFDQQFVIDGTCVEDLP